MEVLTRPVASSVPTLQRPSVEKRRVALAQLRGVEDRVWVRIEDAEPVFAIADEDLDRENEQKTSSVHFLRFELASGMIATLKRGGALAIGVDHPAYCAEVDPVPAATRDALLRDLA
jgi:hypothetical protein